MLHDFACETCGKELGSAYALRRHVNLNRCKVQPDRNMLTKSNASSLSESMQEVKELQKRISTLEEEMKKMSLLMIDVLNTRNTTNIGHNNNNNTINNNNITIIHNYGKEDISHITHDDKIKWAADPKLGIVDYFEKKHFDPTKPENHNVKLASLDSKEVMIHKDGVWERTPANPVLSEAFVKLTDDLLNYTPTYDDIAPETEEYFNDIQENPNCHKAKKTMHAMFCTLDKHRSKHKSKCS